MKTKLLAAAAFSALSLPLLTATPAAAQQRAAAPLMIVVDVERIVRECTACVSATAALSGQENALIQRRNQLAQPIAAEAQAIAQEAARVDSLTGAARTTAINALRTRQQANSVAEQNAQRELQQSQANLQSVQQHVSVQLNRALAPIYQQVMTARGANVVMPANGYLASAAALDATNEVLSLLNQRLPSVNITPLPQGAAPAPTTPQPTTPRPTGR